MPFRRSGTALYDLVGERTRASRVPRAEAPPPSPMSAPESAAGSGGVRPWWMSPGRTVRVPIGYFLLLIPLILIVAVASYSLGYGRGESTLRREQALRETEKLSAGDVVDPLRELPINSSLIRGGGGQGESAGPDGGRSTSSAGAGGQGPEGTLPNLVQSRAQDPRQEGLNYCVIARLGPDESQRLVQFLRGQGLAVAAYPSNNARFRFVIWLNGQTGEQWKSGEADREIQRVGRLYQEQGGPVNFSSRWWDRYDPADWWRKYNTL